MIDDRPEMGDAFGRALEAYHTGETAFEFVERDDGHLEAMTVEHYFSRHGRWSEQLPEAMEHASGRVLDVGCGAGRIALYLQERDHEVVGIDVSQRATEICRERGLGEVHVLDIADVSPDVFDEPFDTVIMYGNNFGLVGTRQTASDVLDRLARVTSPDGTLIAQSRDPLATDDPAHLSYHELNRDRGRLPGALRMRVRYDRYATPWYDYLFAAPETMRELVEPTAWRVSEIIETEGSSEYVGILHKE